MKQILARKGLLGGAPVLDTNALPPIGTVANLRAWKSEHFTIANQAALEPGTDSWSQVIWVYPVSTGTRRNITRKGQTSDPFLGYGLELESDNTIIFRWDGGSQADDFSAVNTLAPVGEWTMLAFTRVPNTVGGVKVYANGVETDSVDSGTENPNSGLQVSLGGAFSSGANFDGFLTRFGNWRRVLSPAELTQLYNFGVGLKYSDLSSGLKTGLESYHDLDEDSDGTSSVNRSDSEGTATAVDQNTTPSFTFSGGKGAGDLVGDPFTDEDDGLQVDGNDLVFWTDDDHWSFGDNDFFIEATVKHTGSPTVNVHIVAHNEASSDENWSFIINDIGLSFVAYDAGLQMQIQSSAGNLINGTENKVKIERIQGVCKLFVNDIEVGLGVNTNPSYSIQNNSGSLNVAARDSSNFHLTGYLKNLTISKSGVIVLDAPFLEDFEDQSES